ncbi:uncharacterized protein TRIADDRAFT_55204 [Trichoplax adhaerens]|uniref:Peptidase A1 domain-containing protein n=1 Tax=Trichoplax adhaerens TaxID=10228 RepID=B3RU95_TRIAD|nr:hypothetical protein TRIADDRAFT_55204 [Trichoplax adhaerens]EDV25772.1 hypothetical protein TRIADDRAFT_55204 [Trichoplax adhaerens]|eukprot:XP_002111805.1 hypothetical protein TRIADDRAFT_55204 [Trichoplax adhaerens]
MNIVWRFILNILAFMMVAGDIPFDKIDKSVKIHKYSLYRVHKWKENNFQNAPSELSTRIDRMRGFPDIGYAIHITVGTPGQQFNALVDTGSSNFAIAASPNAGVPSYYHSRRSSTFQNRSQQVTVQYGKGTWTGDLMSDIVHLDVGFNRAIRQDFSGTPTKTFFDQLVDKTGIANIFSLTLYGPVLSKGLSWTSKDSNYGGEMTFGGIDRTLFLGHVYYTPVIKKWYYEVKLLNISVDGKPITMCCHGYEKYVTFVDSGTTEIVVPPAVFRTIVHSLQKFIQAPKLFWEGREVICPAGLGIAWSSLPIIEFTLPLAGVDGVLAYESSRFNLAISPQQYIRLSETVRNLGFPCYTFSISPSSNDAPVIILGDALMEGYTVVFDRINNQVGFAVSRFAAKNLTVSPGINRLERVKNGSLNIQNISSSSEDSVAIVSVVLASISLFMTCISIGVMTCIYFNHHRNKSSNDYPYRQVSSPHHPPAYSNAEEQYGSRDNSLADNGPTESD